MTARNEGARGDKRKAREAARLDETGDVSALEAFLRTLGVRGTVAVENTAALILASDWLADHVRAAIARSHATNEAES